MIPILGTTRWAKTREGNTKETADKAMAGTKAINGRFV
jgi:hypothetical protein